MPGLTIVDPCDSVDIERAVPQLAASAGPTYLRLLRGQVPTVLDEYDYTFELGKAKVLRGGTDVVLISSGLMTMRALQAAAELADTPRRRRRRAHPHAQTLRHRNRARRGRLGPPRGDLREPHRRRRPVRDRRRGGGPGGARPEDRAGRRCRTSSWRPARCPRCTSATACRDRGSSAPCWSIWADSHGYAQLSAAELLTVS